MGETAMTPSSAVVINHVCSMIAKPPLDIVETRTTRFMIAPLLLLMLPIMTFVSTYQGKPSLIDGVASTDYLHRSDREKESESRDRCRMKI